MQITIYSKNDCVYCTKAKNLVKNLGLDYTEKRLEEFESVDKMLEDIGKNVRQMPQIKIDNELKDHLIRTTMAKLSIDQPNYSGYLKAIKDEYSQD